jgi:DNA polymerase-3 subunit gamma/tau
VRTLKNAFASGRIAHAYLLTGIRGTGKTTTARIIAMGLNCVGPDGTGGPTPEPCGACHSCRAIAEGRSLDVTELDAASHTGIGDMRELQEGMMFGPSASRFKVYILDEAHMLSGAAWNSMLKTVEEPPPHAKFVFATTEARKVPVTVLSRCQRFDLRRVEPEALAGHLAEICRRERVEAEPEALALIARAAEGSVRDSLSLLDQAIALSEVPPVAAATVQEMLGLGDRLRVLDLFDAVMRGRRPRSSTGSASSTGWASTRGPGAGPARRLPRLSRLKVRPEAGGALGLGGELLKRARAMAEDLSLPVLARAWQMLLRGTEEVRAAPDGAAAAEMLLLRLACVAELPPPAELARLIRGDGAPPAHAAASAAPPPPRRASGSRWRPSRCRGLPHRPLPSSPLPRRWRQRRRRRPHHRQPRRRHRAYPSRTASSSSGSGRREARAGCWPRCWRGRRG